MKKNFSILILAVFLPLGALAQAGASWTISQVVSEITNFPALAGSDLIWVGAATNAGNVTYDGGPAFKAGTITLAHFAASLGAFTNVVTLTNQYSTTNAVVFVADIGTTVLAPDGDGSQLTGLTAAQSGAIASDPSAINVPSWELIASDTYTAVDWNQRRLMVSGSVVAEWATGALKTGEGTSYLKASDIGTTVLAPDGDGSAVTGVNAQSLAGYTPIDFVQRAGVPASASDTGTPGAVANDTNYLYICVAADTWKRVALSTW